MVKSSRSKGITRFDKTFGMSTMRKNITMKHMAMIGV